MSGGQAVLLLLSLSSSVWPVCCQQGCDQFQPVNCVLNEDNIVGHARENITQNCQDRCVVTADCGNFTHYQDQCFLLQSCLITEECPDCISGPTHPPFSSCPWPPSPTTTTTTTTTTEGGECEEYIVGMQCDLDEYNVIATFHAPSIVECQSQCRGQEECLWFTWYRDDSQELPSLCLLLLHCDSLEVCDGCISGPRDGQDVEECFGGASTSTVLPPSTSVTTTEVTTNGECGMFHWAACDITEYNTVEVRHNLEPAQCQEDCLLTAQCHVFTWHPSIANSGVCFLLTDCDSFQTCPYCISGPESGGDIESCYDFSTPAPTTTSTTISSSSTTSSGEECDQFVRATCDIDDSNTLDLMHDVFVGQCQDICLYSEECHWFTWYNVAGMRGTCWFLDHCESQEPCPDCISGPALGTDVDSCL